MIEALSLTRTFGARRAVENLSFDVRPGELLGFLGPNGAGKSTTMRMLTGYLAPTSGRVRIDGIPLAESPIQAKSRIGYLPENAPSYPESTVEGFLRFIGAARGLSGKALRNALERTLETCRLREVRRQPVDTLSKGYRHRLGIAQAIIHDPANLILDEPTDGLDPNQKHDMRCLIKEMGERKSVILSTHILEEVEALCNRVIIINRGRIVFNGTPDSLRALSPDAGCIRMTLGTVVPSPLFIESACGLPGVAAVMPTSGDIHTFLIRPDSSAYDEDVCAALQHLCAERQWPILEQTFTRGDLEDIFRRLTLEAPDAAGHEAKHPVRVSARPDTATPQSGDSPEEPVVPPRIAAGVVLRHELRALFRSPVAGIFLVIFLMLAGFFPFMVSGFFQTGQVSAIPFFTWHPWLFMAFVPAIGMRLWAEERRQGTLELLLTLPISVPQAVIGKFLATWLFMGVALLLTFPFPATLFHLGRPDPGPILTGYLGSFLLAGDFLAITGLFSALTRSQVVAFVSSLLACLLLTLAAHAPVVNLLLEWHVNGAAVEAIRQCGVTQCLESLQRGVIDMKDILCLLASTVFCLAATAAILKERR